MPIASAPNAPWVEVWLSPHTTVMPGWVRPSCGPMMWTMPCSASPIGCSRMPNSSQLRRSVSTWMRETGIGDRLVDVDRRHVVVLGGDREIGSADRAAGQPQPVEGLRAGDLVDEVQIDVDQVGLTGGALAGAGDDDVVGPHLLGHGAGCVGHDLLIPSGDPQVPGWQSHYAGR